MNATATSTVTAQAGIEYGSSCETYEEKANKKLANSSTIVLYGYGACIKVEKNALVVKQGFTHEGQRSNKRERYEQRNSAPGY